MLNKLNQPKIRKERRNNITLQLEFFLRANDSFDGAEGLNLTFSEAEMQGTVVGTNSSNFSDRMIFLKSISR